MKRKDSNCVGISSDQGELQLLQTSVNILYTVLGSACFSESIKFDLSFPGWWFVSNEAGDQGWAPATYLEPVGANENEDAEEWISMDDSDRGELSIV